MSESYTTTQDTGDFEKTFYVEPLHDTRASETVITKYSGCYIIQRILQIIFCFKKLKISLSNENIKTCFNLFWSNNCMFANRNEVIWPAYWKTYKINPLKLIDYINISITDNNFISRLTCITNTSNSQNKLYLIANKYVSVLADSKNNVDVNETYSKVIDLITIKEARQQSIASCMLAVENDVIHYFSVKSSTDERWRLSQNFIQFITGWVDDKFISDALVFYIPAIFIKMLFISIQDPNGTSLVDEGLVNQIHTIQTYYIPAKMETPEIKKLPINVSAIEKYTQLLNEHFKHNIVANINILFFAWFFETYMLYEGIGVSAPWPVELGIDNPKELKQYKKEHPEKKIGPIKYNFETEKTSLILKMCIAILSNKSISILLMNGYHPEETYTETMLNVINTFSIKGAFIKTDKIKKAAAVDVMVDDTDVAAVGEDIVDVQVLKEYISTVPSCNTSVCSTSVCSTSGCSADKASEESNNPLPKSKNTILSENTLHKIKDFLGPEFTVGVGENHTRKRNNRKPRTKKQFRHQSKKSNKNIKVKQNNRTNNIRQNNKKPFKKIVK